MPSIRVDSVTSDLFVISQEISSLISILGILFEQIFDSTFFVHLRSNKKLMFVKQPVESPHADV